MSPGAYIFKIVSNFTRPTAREIRYNNFEISLVVFMPNTTTNHAITYTYYVLHEKFLQLIGLEQWYFSLI